MKEALILLWLLVLFGLLFLAAAKFKDIPHRIRDKWRTRRFLRENRIDIRRLGKEVR